MEVQDGNVLPTITHRKSDRGVKSGEGMMDILVNDINRYECLDEREQLLALQSLFSGDGDLQLDEISVSDHASADVNVELQTDISEGNNCYKSVSIEDTDKFILENRNKNTGSKTKSDIKMFFDWCQSNGELRVPEDIPFNELDGLLARFYLGMLDHLTFCVYLLGGGYLKKKFWP